MPRRRIWRARSRALDAQQSLAGLWHRPGRAWASFVLAGLAACASGGAPNAASPAPARGSGAPAGTRAGATPAPAIDLARLQVQHSTADPCLARLPDSLATGRDTAYIHAFILDTAALVLMPEADLLAQRVAARLRDLLGGRRDTLPTGEPLISWRSDIGGNVVVVAHRDGRATWHVLPPSSDDTLAVHAMDSAVALAAAQGDMVTWTHEAGLDSAAIRLAFDRDVEPRYSRGVGPGFAVFAQRMAPAQRPAVLGHPVPPYPQWLRNAGIGGHLVMEAIIDTLGRAEAGSVRDLWPAGYPRFKGSQEAAYEAFVAAARQTVLRARFTPGRIMGCAVRVRVQIPFNFQVRGP